MNKAFAQRLIEHPGETTTSQLSSGVDGVFWVDHREATDDLVRSVAESIGSSELAAVCLDGKWRVRFQDTSRLLASDRGIGEQDETLLALNGVMEGFYEVRLIKVSEGSDTLAFMALPLSDWVQLEAQFGEALEAAFGRIHLDALAFGGSRPDPGLMASLRPLHFSGILLRLCTARDLHALTGPKDARDTTGPLIEPLFGELLLTYYHDRRPRYPTVTQGEAHEYLADSQELRKLALLNFRKYCWPKRKTETRDGVHKLYGEGCMAAATALWLPLWDAFAEELGGPLTVAFPHMDMACFVAGRESDQVAALRASVNATCAAMPDVLSRQLFVRQEASWSPLD